MKRVLKWTVPLDDQNHEIGTGPVLRMEMGPRLTNEGLAIRQVNVWTEESANSQIRRLARVVGTGHTYPTDMRAVATCFDSPFVWHLIVEGEK